MTFVESPQRQKARLRAEQVWAELISWFNAQQFTRVSERQYETAWSESIGYDYVIFRCSRHDWGIDIAVQNKSGTVCLGYVTTSEALKDVYRVLSAMNFDAAEEAKPK